MKTLYALIFLLAMGCIRSKYEPADGDAELFSVDDSDSPELMGVVEDKEGMVTKVPITVSSDLEAVIIEVDGDRQQLEKTGSGEKCHCSFYRNENYAVMVEFLDQKPVKAKVLRLFAEDEEVVVTGSLTDESGLSVKVPINIARDKSTAQFLYQGDDFTLAWDGKIDLECDCRTYRDDSFVVKAFFPGENSGGKAEIRKR